MFVQYTLVAPTAMSRMQRAPQGSETIVTGLPPPFGTFMMSVMSSPCVTQYTLVASTAMCCRLPERVGKPEASATAHVPEAQVSLSQALSQAPQFSALALRFVHTPVQQTTVPALTSRSGPHESPQPLQLSGSDAMSTHWPSHSSSPSSHGGLPAPPAPAVVAPTDPEVPAAEFPPWAPVVPPHWHAPYTLPLALQICTPSGASTHAHAICLPGAHAWVTPPLADVPASAHPHAATPTNSTNMPRTTRTTIVS